MLRLAQFLLILAATSASAQTSAPAAPAGKQLTDRSIELAVVVDATPDQVYRLWTEPELVNQWFAAESVSGQESHTHTRPPLMSGKSMGTVGAVYSSGIEFCRGAAVGSDIALSWRASARVQRAVKSEPGM